MSNTEEMRALKISFGGEIHRIRVDLREFSYAKLCGLFEETFSLRSGQYQIQYEDNEGDRLNVTSPQEFVESCRVLTNSLRFNAISSRQAAFEEQVSAPLLKAIAQLVASLNAAMEKVRQDERVIRAQSNFNQWKQEDKYALKMAELSRTSQQALSQAVEDTRQTLSQLEMDQLLTQVGQNVRQAASDLHDYTTDLVKELQKKQTPETTTTTTDHENQETTTTTTTDSTTDEWETVVSEPVEPAVEVSEPAVEVSEPVVPVSEPVVAPQPEPVVEVSEPVVVVSEPAVEVSAPVVVESRWASELALIGEVFPNAVQQDAVRLLEVAKGDLQYVMNALAEM